MGRWTRDCDRRVKQANPDPPLRRVLAANAIAIFTWGFGEILCIGAVNFPVTVQGEISRQRGRPAGAGHHHQRRRTDRAHGAALVLGGSPLGGLSHPLFQMICKGHRNRASVKSRSPPLSTLAAPRLRAKRKSPAVYRRRGGRRWGERIHRRAERSGSQRSLVRAIRSVLQ